MNPAITNLLKGILLSKTMWANVIAGLAVWLGAHKVLTLDPDTQAQLVGGVLVVMNVLLRFLTTGSLSDKGSPAAILAILLTAGALTACTQDQLAASVAKIQAIEVQAKADANTFCLARGKVMPFVKAGESVASILVPEAAALVALDQTTVDPALTTACRAIDPNATVVAPAKS